MRNLGHEAPKCAKWAFSLTEGWTRRNDNLAVERAHRVAFDVWKLQLRKDCDLRDRLNAFEAMGDYVLSLLWNVGSIQV